MAQTITIRTGRGKASPTSRTLESPFQVYMVGPRSVFFFFFFRVQASDRILIKKRKWYVETNVRSYITLKIETSSEYIHIHASMILCNGGHGFQQRKERRERDKGKEWWDSIFFYLQTKWRKRMPKLGAPA